jgi:hypothetical protein
VIALTGDQVALLGPTSGIYHGTYSLRVTNGTGTDYSGADIQANAQDLAWGFIVSGGDCFTAGVVAGGFCQIDGAVDAPESAGDQATDPFTIVVTVGPHTGSVDLTALTITTTP